MNDVRFKFSFRFITILYLVLRRENTTHEGSSLLSPIITSFITLLHSISTVFSYQNIAFPTAREMQIDACQDATEQRAKLGKHAQLAYMVVQVRRNVTG